MFTPVSEALPKEEGWYICRVITADGTPSYRIDEFKNPSVFQEKYDGIAKGFQLDFGNYIKTEAWMKLTDDYSSHIIKFDNNRQASIAIKGLELNLTLGEIKKASNGDPIIYQYPITGSWDGEVFTSFILVYKFIDGEKVVLDEGKFKTIINESNDPVLKEYMKFNFNYYFIKSIFNDDLKKNNEDNE